MEKGDLVLYILTKLELGGAQKVCLSLLRGIAAHGIKTGLITGAQGVLASEVEGIDNVYRLKTFKREVGLKSILSDCRTFFAMYRLIKKLKREHRNIIVHTHSTKAGILGRWAAFCAGVTYRVHTIHGFAFHDFQPKYVRFAIVGIEYITSFITTHYICVSEKDRVVGTQLFPWFNKKNSLIRAAVDWERFYIPALKIDEQRPLIIGTVSCFKPQKNLIDLLRAFKFVCTQRPVVLHIVGDGFLRGCLERFVHDEGLEKNVVFLGWQFDVASLMKQWDIFVLSSLWEGLPCSVIEARLSRLPVVCYDVGGISEVIIDGKNGFVVKKGDWQTLAERLLKLVSDKSLRITMANTSDNFDVFKNSFMINEHKKMYNKLVSIG